MRTSVSRTAYKRQCFSAYLLGALALALHNSDMNISERLDEAMRRRGFESQSALARASGVGQPTINRILSGTIKDPGSAVLRRLCDALGVPLEALVGTPETLRNSLNSGQSSPLSLEADALIKEVLQLDALGDPARKIFVLMRQILRLATPEIKHKIPSTRMIDVREQAEKLEGIAHATERRGRTKSR